MATKPKLKQYQPLIVIFLLIIGVTALLGVLRDNFYLALTLADFMAAFFLIFGSFKVMRLEAFAEAYSKYDIIAAKSRRYALMYPFIEIGLGLAYLFSFHLPIINWVTLVLMLVNSIGVIISLRKKNKIMCACMGTVFRVPMSWVTLAEDLLMAAMAAVMILIFYF